MKADIERRGRALIVRLEGEADSTGVDVEGALAPVAGAIRSSPPDMVVVDATALGYIDTAAFSTLQRIVEPFGEAGRIRFVGPGPGIANWLRFLDPRPEISFYASVDEALVPGSIRRGGDDGWGAFWRCLRHPPSKEESEDLFVIDLDRELLHLASEGFPLEEAFPALTFARSGEADTPRDADPKTGPLRAPEPTFRSRGDWSELEAIRATLVAEPLPLPSEAIDWDEVLIGVATREDVGIGGGDVCGEAPRTDLERRLAAEQRASDERNRELESARLRIRALEEALAEARSVERRALPRTGPDIAFAARLARRRAIDKLSATAVEFAKAMRLDCDAIRSAVEDLARVVARAPHESYDPVARPASDEMPGVRATNQAAMAMVLESAHTSDPGEVRAAGLIAALDAFVRGSPLLGAGSSRAQRLYDLARTEYFRPLWGEARCPLREPDDVRRRLGGIDAIARFLDEGLGKGTEPPLAVAALFGPDSPVPPEARRAFVEAFSLYPRGSWVELSDGDVGVSIAPQRGLPESPVVIRLYRTEAGRLRSRAPSIAVPGRETWKVKVTRPMRDPLGAGRVHGKTRGGVVSWREEGHECDGDEVEARGEGVDRPEDGPSRRARPGDEYERLPGLEGRKARPVRR